MAKTYVLVGLKGHGKTTVANCLLNKSISNSNISSCTKGTEFRQMSNAEMTIIDANISIKEVINDTNLVLNELRLALEKVNFKINGLVLVVDKEDFSEKTVKFFKILQKHILEKKCLKHSLLVVNKCNENDWLEKNKNKSEVKSVLKKCKSAHELSAHPDQVQIKSLCDKVNETFDQHVVDLSHIKDKKFAAKIRNLISIYKLFFNPN